MGHRRCAGRSRCRMHPAAHGRRCSRSGCAAQLSGLGLHGGRVLSHPGGWAPLLAAAAARQEQLARGRVRWAVVECAAEEVLPLYLRQGFALRAIRPLDSLAPCFWLQAGCLGQNQPPVWVPLADRVHIAILLARGYAALESRESPQGTVLALYPV